MSHAAVAHGSHVAHVVAFVGFDLDHVRAQFGEDLRGEWTHHHCGEVEDFYSG